MAEQSPSAKKETIAKRSTAIKRDIQNEKKRLRNRAVRSQVRGAIKTFEDLLSKGDQEAAKKSLNQVYSLVDHAVQKGIYKLNAASRTKSRLTARLAKA